MPAGNDPLMQLRVRSLLRKKKKGQTFVISGWSLDKRGAIVEGESLLGMQLEKMELILTLKAVYINPSE